MRTVRHFVLILYSTLCLAAAPPQDAGVAPLSIGISAPQDTVQSGSEVQIEVTITNTSDQNLRYRPLSWPDVKEDVRDSQGRPAPETAYGRELHARHIRPTAGSFPGTRILEPGDNVRYRYPLTVIYDLSRPDTYTVQVQRQDPVTKTIVKSNTITVTVTP